MSETAIQLTSGRLFDYLEPRADAICATEIADTLSVVPRFGGRARFASGAPWSVAQHCLLVHFLVTEASPSDTGAAVWALLHDAHEAYTGDLPTPFKHAISKTVPFDVVASFERAIDAAIRERFGLRYQDVAEHPLVERADVIALETERAQLLKRCATDWGNPELARRDFRLCEREPAAVSREYQYALRRALEAYHLQRESLDQLSLAFEPAE